MARALVPALLLLALLGPAPLTTARGSVPAARVSVLAPFKLALQADWIVDATILHSYQPRHDYRSQEERWSMTLRVHSVIAGSLDGDELEVMQFQDWTCASRYTPYRPGQRAVFHLWRPRTTEGRLDPERLPHPMGSSNEGECPILGDQLLHEGYGWPRANPAEHRVHDADFRGVATDKAEYVEAVRGLRRCFLWARDPDTPRYFTTHGLTPRVSEEERAAYGRSSPTAARMLANVEKGLDRIRSR